MKQTLLRNSFWQRGLTFRFNLMPIYHILIAFQMTLAFSCHPWIGWWTFGFENGVACSKVHGYSFVWFQCSLTSKYYFYLTLLQFIITSKYYFLPNNNLCSITKRTMVHQQISGLKIKPPLYLVMVIGSAYLMIEYVDPSNCVHQFL